MKDAKVDNITGR